MRPRQGRVSLPLGRGGGGLGVLGLPAGVGDPGLGEGLDGRRRVPRGERLGRRGLFREPPRPARVGGVLSGLPEPARQLGDLGLEGGGLRGRHLLLLAVVSFVVVFFAVFEFVFFVVFFAAAVVVVPLFPLLFVLHRRPWGRPRGEQGRGRERDVDSHVASVASAVVLDGGLLFFFSEREGRG